MEHARKKIIMVDHDIGNLHTGKKILIDTYDVFTVPSGEKLFLLLRRVTPDLILLEAKMSEMSGYDVLRALKNSEATADIPVILLTAMNDRESEAEGLALGAIDYIAKPFSPPLLLKRIEIHMLIESQKSQLRQYRERSKTVFDLQNAVLKTVADLVERRDDVSEGHIERTQGYLWVLTNALLADSRFGGELATWDIDAFILAAGLHDIGKIAIRDRIILKPDSLTVGEFDEMKAHTDLGVEIIRKLESGTGESVFLEHAKTLAASHHERWDGAGYPRGLGGRSIPLQGRIMAIVDVYDVLTHDRPYKKAISHEEAVAVIKSEGGSHFDPELVEVFLDAEQNFREATCSGDRFANVARGEGEIAGELQTTVSRVISEIVDYRNSAESGGLERIRGYMKILLDAMQKHERYRETVLAWDIDLLILSAELYDIGKISIKDEILWKPEKLTEAEYIEMQTHTDLGVKAIRAIGESTAGGAFLEYAENLTGLHHEKWDGTGYPSGLSGEDIPLQSRLMAIVDVYEALCSSRRHMEAFSHKEAVEMICGGSGTQFDPGLIEVFLECEGEFESFKSGRN